MAPSKSGQQPVPPYAKDEKVLCFHHDLLYEAKVLDIQMNTDPEQSWTWRCKIHYKGWKATWDDWVPESRVMKFNDENKELAAQLHQDMKKMNQKPKSATSAGGKKLGAKTNGSEVGSGRGSEERHASVAAVGGGGGRGGPRRNRDYELEQMAPSIAPSVKLPAKPFAKKTGNTNPALLGNIKKPQLKKPQKTTVPKKINQVRFEEPQIEEVPVEKAPFKGPQKRPQKGPQMKKPQVTNIPKKFEKSRVEGSQAKKYEVKEAPAKSAAVKRPQVKELQTKKPQHTNVQKGAKGKAVVEASGVRKSARERRPVERYDHAIIDSDNMNATKPKPKRTVKNPDWANPKSEHWNVLKFLELESPKSNLDARPPPKFQYIFNGSLRAPETYRPDETTYVYAPKQKSPPVHPKLQSHIKNGTDTQALRQYYGNLEPGESDPIAGRLYDNNHLPPAQLKRKRLFPLSYDEAAKEEKLKPSAKKAKIILTLNKSSHGKTPAKAPAKTTGGATEKKNVHFEGGTRYASEVRERYVKTTKKMLPRISKTNSVMEERDFNYLQEESFHHRPSINLVIPDHIKAILVDDWENVTKNMQLVPLPHKKPVEQILNDWVEFEKAKRPVGSAQADILDEIVSGLREYFERCLGRILLYRFERQQFIDLRTLWDDDSYEQSCASDTYGAEHLCRLLVTLPELIAQTNMDIQSVNRLREELSKLTNFIGKNAKDYFANEYETPTTEYMMKAKSNA